MTTEMTPQEKLRLNKRDWDIYYQGFCDGVETMKRVTKDVLKEL